MVKLDKSEHHVAYRQRTKPSKLRVHETNRAPYTASAGERVPTSARTVSWNQALGSSYQQRWCSYCSKKPEEKETEETYQAGQDEKVTSSAQENETR